jgi:hypothetical protein
VTRFPAATSAAPEQCSTQSSFRAGKSQVLDAPRPLSLWHLASVDAPTVAIAWAFAFAWIWDVHLPASMPVAIALAVWAVYVIDRLLDARTGLRSAGLDRLRERHFFHWHHRRTLGILALVAASAATWIVLELVPLAACEHSSTIVAASLIAAASLAYFIGVHGGWRKSRFFSKEFFVGVLFTAGCALPGWSQTSPAQERVSAVQLLTIVYFARLAWLNCRAISCWEAGYAETAARSVRSLGFPFAALGALLAVMLYKFEPRSAALLLCGTASAVLLAMLDHHRHKLSSLALRTAADFVLLTPLLIFACAPGLHQ